MKKILVLTVALVLAFSAVAFAETSIKTSGKVVLDMTATGTAFPVYSNTYRVQFDGTIDENHGFQARWEGAAGTFGRANYWVNIPGVGKVTAGKQNVNYSALDVFDSNLNVTKPMIAFAPALPAGKAVGFWVPDNNPDNAVFGGEASFDVAGATIYGGAFKTSSVDDVALTFGGSYPVIADQFIVYGEYNKFGAAVAAGDEDDAEKVLGAEYKVAGFDIYGEYAIDAKTSSIDIYKTVNGVEFNVKRTMPKEAEGETYICTTLYF